MAGKVKKGSIDKGRYRDIVATARRLFADQGFEAVSIFSIAQKAGVSKANIYHYFPSKDALYLAVLQEAASELRDHLQELIAHQESPLEALRQFASSHLRQLLDHPRLVRLFLRELLEKDEPRAKELAEAGMADLFATLVEVLRQGQRQGLFRAEVDPALVATMLLGANLIFFQSGKLLKQYPQVHFEDNPERYDHDMVEILLRGILQQDSAIS